MDNRTLVKVTESLKKQRRRKRWHKTVGFMGLVVLVATVAALVIPASTLAKEPVCGLEEHIHTESCYTETPVLSCGLEEAPAHSHTDACYAESSKLVCGMEESEEHSHTDSCYGTEQTLICKLPETQGHTHSDACYTIEQMLFCKKTEHTHTEDCYEPEKKQEIVSAEEVSASDAETPQGDPTADVESRADWEATLSGAMLTGDWAEDILAIADSQLGYQESSRNFITDETGKQKGYSRYGAWYGDAYGDWCAMFASFCLYYADVPTEKMPEEASCPRWIQSLAAKKLYASAAGYTPRPGDLVFFDENQDGTADHVGIVYAADAAAIKTIEGNSDDKVQYVKYALGDAKIVGYGMLPENPEQPRKAALPEGQTYYYEDDTIGAAVALPKDSEVPENAQLRVTPITEKNKDYDTLTEQAENAVSGETSEIALYDISFYTENDEYIPVSDQAQVALWFKETLSAEADQSVEVLHFDENQEAPVALEQVEATKDTDDNVSLVTFETPGFSVFAVVTVVQKNPGTGEIAVTGLDGQTFAIVNVNSERPAALTATKSGTNRMVGQLVTVSGAFVTGENVTEWTFEAAKNNTYYIYSGNNYLSLSSSSLTIVTRKNQASTFTVSLSDSYPGQVKLSANNTTIDWYGNSESQGNIFGPWNADAANNYQALCRIKKDAEFGFDTNLSAITRADGSALGTSKWDSEYQPTLTAAQARIDAEENPSGVLPALSGKTENGRFIYYAASNRYIGNLYKDSGEDPDSFEDASKVWGKEFLFDCWEAKDANGVLCQFPETAAYTANTDGSISIEDVDGVKRNVPGGTVFEARYKLFSDVVIFSVNYKGTILDTTGNISANTGETWTPTVVVGHVYNPETTAGSSEYYAVEAHSKLTEMFRETYDPDDSGPQIVVDGFVTSTYEVTTQNGKDVTTVKGMPTYQKAHGATPDQVKQHLMSVLYNNKAEIWLNSAKNPAPTVEVKNLNTNRYDVRWYVLKETANTTDGWHIDGVLVAKTEPVRVTKEFHGLDNDADIASKFYIEAGLQKDGGNIPYFDIKTSNDNEVYGMYTYDGKEDGQYRWTVNLIKDEPFVLTEKAYQKTGYDCATVITVRYKDGKSEQLFKNVISVSDIKGGEVESIVFDNYYTSSGTGMLYIHKYAVGISEDILDSALAGADFELSLTGPSGTTVKVTSDSNGTVFFPNLRANTTYKLTETKAPEGFVLSGKEWTVKVGSSTDNVKVTDENNVVLYETSSGINQALNIGNTPDTNTLTVTKRFVGDITAAQVAQMKDYMITVTGKNSSGEEKEYTLTQTGVKDETGEPAGTVSVADGLFFTWQLTEVTGTNYQVQEKNYLPDSIAEDTMVSVSVAAIEPRETQVGPVTVDNGKDTAEFPATLDAEQSDAFAIVNKYIDSFTLQIEKVDTAGNIPLDGAQFKVYGPYLDAASIEDKIELEVDGKRETYYYHGTTEATEDGVVRYTVGTMNKELKLGKTYVVVESQQPEGYLLNATPISTGVVNRENENYSNGVYTMTVVNSKNFTIEVEKIWNGEAQTSVTMRLWRSPTEDGKLGEAEEVPESALEITEETGWKGSWEVPLYAPDGTQYAYFVVEDYIGGYSTSYNVERDVLSDGNSAALVPLADVISGKNLTTTVVVTNTAGGALPHTGGAGTYWFTFGGIALLMMAIYVLIKPRRRREAD